MTCLRIRRLIPLAAGDDLRPRLAAAVRAHIDACPGCREELVRFRTVLTGIRIAAKTEGIPEWRNGEWAALMATVTREARGGQRAQVGVGAHAYRPRWAAASVVGAAIGLAVLFVLFRGPSVQTGRTSDKGLWAAASGALPQDKVAITMVSPETGLQVVWILDKNFDYKGEQE